MNFDLLANYCLVQKQIDWQPYLVAAAAALFGFFARYIYDLFIYRSRLEVNEGVFGPTEQSGIQYYRLVITNNGRWRAKSVSALIEDRETGNKKERGFLPSPLPWTHQGNVIDIQKRQPVHLDLIEYKFDKEENKYILRLLSDEIKPLHNLSRFKKGNTVLKVNLYQQSGQVIKIEVSLYWNGKDKPSKLSARKIN